MSVSEDDSGHPPQQENLVELLPATLKWLATLPPELRPHMTAQKHPHVLEQLCRSWECPTSLHGCFVELLIDRRSDRQGFSFAVFTELMALLNHCAAQFSGEQRNFWKDYPGQFNFNLD